MNTYNEIKKQTLLSVLYQPEFPGMAYDFGLTDEEKQSLFEEFQNGASLAEIFEKLPAEEENKIKIKESLISLAKDLDRLEAEFDHAEESTEQQ